MNGLKHFLLWAVLASAAAGLAWIIQKWLAFSFPVFALVFVSVLGYGLYRLVSGQEKFRE